MPERFLSQKNSMSNLRAIYNCHFLMLHILVTLFKNFIVVPIKYFAITHLNKVIIFM